MRLTEPRPVTSLDVLWTRVTVAVLACDAAAAADDEDETTDTAGITCLAALLDVTKLLVPPRVSVVRITDDCTRDLGGPDVIRGRTTGTRDGPPRLMMTGPEVDVWISASPDNLLSFTLTPAHITINRR